MKVLNRPTPEGRELGEQLARLTEVAERELRQRFPNLAAPCGTCAFRRGTIPNGCPETVMDALKATMECVTFLCHESPGGHEEKPTGVCAGWLIATSATAGKPPIDCPWPFSDEPVAEMDRGGEEVREAPPLDADGLITSGSCPACRSTAGYAHKLGCSLGDAKILRLSADREARQ